MLQGKEKRYDKPWTVDEGEPAAKIKVSRWSSAERECALKLRMINDKKSRLSAYNSQ